jgi:hypothetical protein
MDALHRSLTIAHLTRRLSHFSTVVAEKPRFLKDFGSIAK